MKYDKLKKKWLSRWSFDDLDSAINPEYTVNPVKKVSLKDLNCYKKILVGDSCPN